MKFVAIAIAAMIAAVSAMKAISVAGQNGAAGAEIVDGTTSVATVGPSGVFETTINAAGASSSIISLGAIAAAVAAFAL